MKTIKCDGLLERGKDIGEADKEKLLEEFVSRNPNPFLKVRKDGTVLYANRAADVLLESWGIKEREKVPQSLQHIIEINLSQENPEYFEIKIGKIPYYMVLNPLSEEDCVSLQGFDISLRVQEEEKLRRREKQYLSLSNLGRISITCKDFQSILEESSRFIAQGLCTEFSTIAELMPDGNFILKAGYGWEDGLVGNTFLRGKKESHAGYTLLSRKPVVLKDIETESRFKCIEPLRVHGVVSGVTVLIGDMNKPFGVMGVYSTEKRDFTVDDIYFLDSAASLLSEIIEHFQAEEKLRVHQQELEHLVERRTIEYTEANEKLAQEITERRKIEKTLRNNLKFLETLLNTIPAPVLYKDNDGRYLGCNDILARQILGLEKEEIIGKTFPEVYRDSPSEFSLEIHRDDLELLQKGGSDNYEKEIMCADGIKRTFLTSRATFFDEERKSENMVAVLLDVTELRKVENKLQNNIQFLETLLDNIPSPVFQRDLNGRYVNCNESFARQIMDLPKNMVIGGSFNEFQKRVPKELAEIYRKHDRKLIEKGGNQYYETKVVCADGVQRDFLFHKATYASGSGEVAGIVGVMLDITQRKAAEKTFRKSEERYRIAAEQTGQLVYDYDIESGTVDWAGAILQITGYSPEEFKGADLEYWITHVHEEDRKKAWDAHEKCMETGGKYFEEYRFRKKDGTYFHAEDSGVYLSDENGRVHRIVGVIKNITERKIISEIVERSEERHRAVAVQTGQIIYDYDVEINCSSWAGAIEELTGYNFEEFQSFTPDVWADHVHPEDRQKAIRAHESCMINGEKYFEEYRLRRKDGSYFYVEDSGVYLKNEKKGIYRVLGVMKDITERKIAQEKLEKSEEKYRIATEQTGQIVFDYNTRTGEVDWAGAILELTGYSYEEFQKVNPAIWIEHIHPEDRERVIETVSFFFEKGERLREEFRFRRKDGNYIYVEDRGILLRDENGSSYRILGVIKDITEIKLASEKLKESEQRYRLFLKNYKGIAFQGEMNFIPILMEGSLEEITGYSREDFVSRRINWCQIVLPEDRKKLFENTEKLKNDPLLLIEHEYRIKHRDGKIKWVREIIQSVSDNTGKQRILQGAIYDITRQKEAEESLRKVEEIRKKEIHHRIKNNLQVISSLLELQAEKFDEKEVLEAFRESQNRVATMAIIHEELYRSKNNETLDFSAYLRKLTADLFSSYAVRTDCVKMQLNLEEAFLGMDTAVPLGIIINELVSNSLKHAFPSSRTGEIGIELCRIEEIEMNKNISNITNNIGARSSVDKSIQYRLVVSDNGLGFPENIDFRNTSSLGLQLVNLLVEQLEGTIELEKGRGTAFKILFKENS